MPEHAKGKKGEKAIVVELDTEQELVRRLEALHAAATSYRKNIRDIIDTIKIYEKLREKSDAVQPFIEQLLEEQARLMRDLAEMTTALKDTKKLAESTRETRKRAARA